MEESLGETVFIIENTNKLYFDYMSFKKFAGKNNYQLIISRILERIDEILKTFKTFEIHVNLFSFCTTSLAKYGDFLCIFADYSNVFGDKLTDLYIYYTPSIMDSIFKILTKHIFNQKNQNTNIPRVVMYSKSESDNYLSCTFSSTLSSTLS
jgi:hypothetical protein